MRFQSYFFVLLIFTSLIAVAVSTVTAKTLYISGVFPANTPPSITSVNISGYSGDILITYNLEDNETDASSIFIQFKGGCVGDIWTPATLTGTTTNILPANGLTVIWNSKTDLPLANGEEYTLRICANDGLINGSWYESSAFHIINTYSISQLAFDNVFSPQINNSGYVVWTGDLFSGTTHISRDIYLYDGTTTSQITNFDYFAFAPNISDSGQIVWNASDGFDGTANTGNDLEIYSYDGVTTQLSSNNFIDNDAQINNNGYTVWTGFDGTDFEIFLDNGTTTTQITNNTGDDVYPRINDLNQIVWRYYDGVDWEIFLYDGLTTTQITDNTFDDNDAQINNNGYITWSEFDGNDWEIFLYNGTIVTQITDNITNDRNPRINDSNHIVWQQWDGNDWEIFLYDTIIISQITDNDIDDINPKINEKNTIAWQGSTGSNAEIFLYTDTTPTQLTFDSLEDINPQINDHNQLVWTRWNGTFWEIILAVPSNPALEILSIEEVANFAKLVWTTAPNLSFKIFWADTLQSPVLWNELDGSALNDIIDNPDNTHSWIDYGTDPDMNGQSSANVSMRYYKIIGVCNH